MAVVIKREVKPLAVLADKAVGVVHAAFGAIDGFLLKHALVGPGLHAVKADPQGHGAAVFAVGIVQDGHAIPAETIKRGLGAWVGNVCLARHGRPGASAIRRFSVEEYSAETVGTNDHGDAPVLQFDDIVLGPAAVGVVIREANVAVLAPRLAAVAADEHAVARVADVEGKTLPFVLRQRGAGGRAFIVLEGHQDAPVASDDVISDERAIMQPTRHGLGLTPGAA